MIRCPNCGRKTDDDECQWCHYPILRGSPKKRPMVERREPREATSARKIISKVCEGNVELVIPSTVEAGYKQIRQFREQLEQLENVKVVWTGGSDREGSTIAVSVQKPMNLAHIINEMPIVEKVQQKGKRIVIRLKIDSPR